jgi:ABC-type phosphate transport system substrate-binding protein
MARLVSPLPPALMPMRITTCWWRASSLQSAFYSEETAMKKTLVLAFLLLGFLRAEAQIAVIANKSVPDAAAGVRKVATIYALELTKWSDGTKIIVIDQSGDAKEKFYPAIGFDPLALRKAWLKKQLTGEAKAPDLLHSDTEVLSRVAATPGAVGYINSSKVTSDVKVICEIK